MYVEIGPYKDWFGPHQLAEKLLFWLDKDNDTVYSFGEWLAHGSKGEDHYTPLYKLMLWVERKRTRDIHVVIDEYDTWSLDSTLSHIILPALKAFKVANNGYFQVPDSDMPKHLLVLNDEQRWDWVLDEMIFFHERVLDADADSKWLSMSKEGRDAESARLERAALLFGKYYTGLWW